MVPAPDVRPVPTAPYFKVTLFSVSQSGKILRHTGKGKFILQTVTDQVQNSRSRSFFLGVQINRRTGRNRGCRRCIFDTFHTYCSRRNGNRSSCIFKSIILRFYFLLFSISVMHPGIDIIFIRTIRPIDCYRCIRIRLPFVCHMQVISGQRGNGSQILKMCHPQCF